MALKSSRFPVNLQKSADAVATRNQLFRTHRQKIEKVLADAKSLSADYHIRLESVTNQKLPSVKRSRFGVRGGREVCNMPFWSGPTLRSRLSEVIDKPDLNCVDCAAYTLKVGPEYYVTPNDQTSNSAEATLQQPQVGESFAIPAGQFGYVLTEEIVSIPTSAIAFISIRAKVKWKGLINVSGFHVDPGFRGRLLFAVFNAGPSSIHLRRGDPTFLIWFADLDRDSKEDSKHGGKVITQIETNAMNQVSGEIYSVQGLADKTSNYRKRTRSANYGA